MKFRKLLAGAVIAQGLALLDFSAANADEILTYTGNDFTSVTSPYTMSNKVTATIDLATPLGPSLPLTTVTPVSFVFNDGQQTINQTNDNPAFTLFQFSTDQSGNISTWVVDVAGATVSHAILTDKAGTSAGDVGQILLNVSFGMNSLDPGIWTTSATPVPEPSTILLFGTGLLGLAFLGRRGRQILSRPRF